MAIEGGTISRTGSMTLRPSACNRIHALKLALCAVAAQNAEIDQIPAARSSCAN